MRDMRVDFGFNGAFRLFFVKASSLHPAVFVSILIVVVRELYDPFRCRQILTPHISSLKLSWFLSGDGEA